MDSESMGAFDIGAEYCVCLCWSARLYHEWSLRVGKELMLPFKIEAQTKGAQKAYKRFTKTYGKKEGERIYLAYADEHGTGATIRQKVNSVFKKGGHLH